ncbi:MAG TPA: alpha-amylase family glycosyl hydrolase [Polyangia bacterium]|nr:alpha-amylase family glycosyl hydrolase [Polyangia bacterium]
MSPRYPLLYQLNTRVLVGEAAATTGAAPTLDALPDALLGRAAARGFDWIWMLGVWQTGEAGRREALAPAMRAEYARDVPDVREQDVAGSPFAIAGYDVAAALGGDAALARLRERLRARGLRVMLDFVPNHVALDHPWVDAHPEYFVAGSDDDLRREPGNYVRLRTARGERILAHGRDPHFPGWTDTLQLNYRHAGLREAMVDQLLRVADRCDGVRCDMAMLLEPEVFARTWSDRARPADGSPPVDAPFWPEAIARVRRQHPEFLFLAEVYWGLDWQLQQQGFDFTYDKTLYDRLRAGAADPVRAHLRAEPAFADRCARFLENHDEPRAAAVFPPDRHRAAAALAYLLPGLRFFHEGQLEGRRARAPIQLTRRAPECPDPAVGALYDDLLALLARPLLRDGTWRLCDVGPADTAGDQAGDQADGDQTARGWRDVIAFRWQLGKQRMTVAVNYGPHPTACRIDPPDGGAALVLAPWSYDLKEDLLPTV